MKTSLRELSGKNVLVIGGAGFIGSHLVDQLAKSAARRVGVIDNLFLGKIENLKDAIANGAVFYQADAEHKTELVKIFNEFQPQVVFNCATKALNYSFIDPSDAFQTNTKVALNLLELLREKLFESLCHFSSSEVYGTALYTPMDEKHPLNPTTTYAAGKASADLALESYVRMFNLDAFIVRPFNNYGPRQNTKPPLAGLIPLTIERILENKNPEIHGSGDQTRDFTYVLDTVDVILKLYSQIQRGDSVHVASSQVVTVTDVIYEISSIMGYPVDKILKKPARSSDVQTHSADTKKMNSFGKFNFIPFNVGLRKTVEFLVSEKNKEARK